MNETKISKNTEYFKINKKINYSIIGKKIEKTRIYGCICMSRGFNVSLSFFVSFSNQSFSILLINWKQTKTHLLLFYPSEQRIPKNNNFLNLVEKYRDIIKIKTCYINR